MNVTITITLSQWRCDDGDEDHDNGGGDDGGDKNDDYLVFWPVVVSLCFHM